MTLFSPPPVCHTASIVNHTVMCGCVRGETRIGVAGRGVVKRVKKSMARPFFPAHHCTDRLYRCSLSWLQPEEISEDVSCTGIVCSTQPSLAASHTLVACLKTDGYTVCQRIS